MLTFARSRPCITGLLCIITIHQSDDQRNHRYPQTSYPSRQAQHASTYPKDASTRQFISRSFSLYLQGNTIVAGVCCCFPLPVVGSTDGVLRCDPSFGLKPRPLEPLETLAAGRPRDMKRLKVNVTNVCVCTWSHFASIFPPGFTPSPHRKRVMMAVVVCRIVCGARARVLSVAVALRHGHAIMHSSLRSSRFLVQYTPYFCESTSSFARTAVARR